MILIVIGERVVTPSSIIYLLVKLRITPFASEPKEKEPTVDEAKKAVEAEEAADEEFLTSRLEAEEIPQSHQSGTAHAPFWPGVSISHSSS